METPIPFSSAIGCHNVQQWSSENQGHAPITITIDFKDDLTDNIDYMNGSMDKLNDIFVSTLGNAIFAPMYFAGECRQSMRCAIDLCWYCLVTKNPDNCTNETVDTIRRLPSMIPVR